MFSSDVRVKVVHCLICNKKPLTCSEIANFIGIPRQKVQYHLPILISNGLILPVDPDRFQAQPLFQARDELMQHLEPLVEVVASTIDDTSADSSEESIVNFLAYYLYFIGLDSLNGGGSDGRMDA